jgi:orotidine-5'-phosphate decarboxylase
MGAAQYAAHLAQVSAKAGLDGIVCSAADLPVIRPSLPADFEIITPGIRLPDGEQADQKRIATPQAALAGGATLLVVGRPITEAENPEEAAGKFEGYVSEFLSGR